MVSNEYFVGKGKMLTHRGQRFPEGRRFPAADLGLDDRSFESLIRDKSIVTGKERNAFFHPKPAPVPVAPAPKAMPAPAAPLPPVNDGLDAMKKDDLLDMAEDLGIKVSARMSKEEIARAIREKTA